MKNIQIERTQKEVGLVLGKDGETIGEVYHLADIGSIKEIDSPTMC